MVSQSFPINNVFIDSYATLVSKKEKEGPLGSYFSYVINDYYYGCKTFEKAQSKMCKSVIKRSLAKSKYRNDDICIAIGGDLSNQIFSSTSAICDYNMPFIGVYAACASGILSIIIGSIFMNLNNLANALCYTSSHLCVSEKQFRYPNEYGIQKKFSGTTTVTGAGAVILTNDTGKIKISKATIGKVIDIDSKNVNDMGTIMAFAAVDTLLTHLENNNEKISDYDLIVTGDLSRVGSKVFKDELRLKGLDISHKHKDCGTLIYDDNQNCESGGSGSGCVMCVMLSYYFEKIIKGDINKMIIIGTGSLHSQISTQQKESIPSIAHLIVLERNI